MKILVVTPNWIGDCVMAQPMFSFIKQRHPGACLVALAPKWVGAVLRFMPEIDDVIEHQLGHGGLQLADRWVLAGQIRSQKFSIAYVLPNSMKSALILFLARIQLRIGYQGEMRIGLLNQRLSNPFKKQRPPMVEHYARLAGWQPMDGEIPQPKLSIAFHELLKVRRKYDALKNYWVFCPGAEYGEAKRWPVAHYAALGEQLQKHDSSMPILLLGSPKDDVVAQEIMSQAPNVLWQNLCGKTTLAEACALLSSAYYVVTNDSGLMHVTASMRVPQIAVFGSTDPNHTPPLSPKAKIIWLKLNCSPCFQRECPLGHLNCLKDITPQQVYDTMFARRMLTDKD